jgi:hypothetical protein
MDEHDRPTRPNWRPPHPSEMDHERWKSSPSTEVDGDRGRNAAIERERKIEENSPPRGRETRRGHAVVSDDEDQ